VSSDAFRPVIEFQTNSREVEASTSRVTIRQMNRFRRTLVRLKPSGKDRDACSDAGFRRTLVRLKLQPLRAQGRHRHSFRRTLVRLKRRLRFLPTRRGLFQTNSREVEAIAMSNQIGADEVSDELS